VRVRGTYTIDMNLSRATNWCASAFLSSIRNMLSCTLILRCYEMFPKAFIYRTDDMTCSIQGYTEPFAGGYPI
jgi:hypothetical protein